FAGKTGSVPERQTIRAWFLSSARPAPCLDSIMVFHVPSKLDLTGQEKFHKNRILTVLKFWLPLLDEGFQALFHVLGGANMPKKTGFQPQPLPQRQLAALAHGPEDTGNGHAAHGGDPTRQALGVPEHLSIRDHVVEQARGLGLLYRDVLTGQEKLERFGTAQVPWQPLCAAEPRDDPQFDLRLTHLGPIRSDTQVACHGELHAAAQANAV